MSKLLDPTICPDCRAPLDPEQTCTGCGLRLSGPTAAELWQLILRADALVERLRTEPLAATATLPAAPLPAVPGLPVPGLPTPAHPGRRGLSVPVVLLGLGALCVLVAAIVFVAVTWSSLGLGAKAAIMLGVTGLFAGAGVVLTRRGLRGAAETFWSIVAVLLVVDLAAAYGADLAGFGDLPGRHAAAVTGAALLLLGIGAGRWAATTPTRRLTSMVATAAGGTLVLTAAEVFAAERVAVAATVAIPVVLGLAVLVGRSPALRPTGIAVGVTALVSWAALVSVGIDQAARTPVTRWWQDLDGWPLLVAAGYAAALTVGTRLPAAVRAMAATGSLVTLALFALGGTGREDGSTLAVASAVAVALAAVSAFAGRDWAVPAAVMSALALLSGTAYVGLRPWASIGGLPTTGPAHELNLNLRLPAVPADPAPWTAIVVAVAVVLTAAGLLRHLPDSVREAARTGWFALVPTALALGTVTAVLESEPRLVIAVSLWATVLVLAGAAAVLAREHPAALAGTLVVGGYLAVLGLRLAVPSHLLVALLASALATGLAVAYGRARSDRLGGALLPVLAGSGLVAAGFAGTHWPYLADGAGDTAGIVLVAIAAVALLAAKPTGRTEPARRTIEAVAVALGLLATQFPTDSEVSVGVLTAIGTAVALTGTLHRDRDLLGWGAVVLLGVAAAARLDLDLDAPEVATLPAALLLVAGGCYRLRTDAEASSWRALSSGLVLGLLPSLLLALDEPVTLRGALVAAAGVAVLGAGVRTRWAAPVVAGALTCAVLALRHLGPVAEAVPRWLSLGSVGLVFLLVGITWEARRRNLATADRYLAALR